MDNAQKIQSALESAEITAAQSTIKKAIKEIGAITDEMVASKIEVLNLRKTIDKIRSQPEYDNAYNESANHYESEFLRNLSNFQDDNDASFYVDPYCLKSMLYGEGNDYELGMCHIANAFIEYFDASKYHDDEGREYSGGVEQAHAAAYEKMLNVVDEIAVMRQRTRFPNMTERLSLMR